jgi:hypothetical protein
MPLLPSREGITVKTCLAMSAGHFPGRCLTAFQRYQSQLVLRVQSLLLALLHSGQDSSNLLAPALLPASTERFIMSGSLQRYHQAYGLFFQDDSGTLAYIFAIKTDPKAFSSHNFLSICHVLQALQPPFDRMTHNYIEGARDPALRRAGRAGWSREECSRFS